MHALHETAWRTHGRSSRNVGFLQPLGYPFADELGGGRTPFDRFNRKQTNLFARWPQERGAWPNQSTHTTRASSSATALR